VSKLATKAQETSVKVSRYTKAWLLDHHPVAGFHPHVMIKPICPPHFPVGWSGSQIIETVHTMVLYTNIERYARTNKSKFLAHQRDTTMIGTLTT
jgi:hypothetical protein